MNKNIFYILMVFAMIFWGISWVNVKFLTYYINEYEVVFLRMGISAIMMIPILKFMKIPFKVDYKTLFLVFVASAILVLYSIYFFLGVKYGTAGLGGALVTTLIPINTFIIIAFLHRKTISLKHSFALVLGGFGVLTMLDIWQFDLQQVFSKQNIFFIIASLLWPILTIVSSKSTKINPMMFTFYVYSFSSVFIYIFFIDINIFTKVLSFDYIFWINSSIIIVLSTVFATSVYFLGIEKLGAKEVSSFIFLVPCSALVFSSIFLDEKISYTTALGTICTIVAIYILNNIKLQFFKS